MKVYDLYRHTDVSGVSGVGVVAEAVEFPPDGLVVLRWRNSGSLGVYRSLDVVIEIHGHDGQTELQLRWQD